MGHANLPQKSRCACWLTGDLRMGLSFRGASLIILLEQCIPAVHFIIFEFEKAVTMQREFVEMEHSLYLVLFITCGGGV